MWAYEMDVSAERRRSPTSPPLRSAVAKSSDTRCRFYCQVYVVEQYRN